MITGFVAAVNTPTHLHTYTPACTLPAFVTGCRQRITHLCNIFACFCLSPNLTSFPLRSERKISMKQLSKTLHLCYFVPYFAPTLLSSCLQARQRKCCPACLRYYCASAALRIRAVAMAMYSASRSMPTKRKPSANAATPVLPLPKNGSRTTPPGGVTRRHR